MVDIRIGLIPSIQHDPHGGSRKQPLPLKKEGPAGRDRRKRKADRRRNVRDGVVVTLSTQTDRRQRPDRRKK